MLIKEDTDHTEINRINDVASVRSLPAERWASSPRAQMGLAWQSKVVIECGGALLMLTTILPLLAVIALAILLESGRPVLFLQPRFGRFGVPFSVLKFRTMHQALCDPSGAAQTDDADPRITRVGQFLRKTSLDELPQLWNVVAGQMALIGPRAHPCGMCVQDVLCETLIPYYHNRHVVRPGITGWAQVNGSRGAVKSVEALMQRVALDLDYIATWSLLLDLKILWRTIHVVFSRTGAQ